jgi:hypothetical protein
MAVLVGALTGSRRSLPGLERTIAAGHVIGCSTLVMYEWLRGPRTEDERTHPEWLVPASHAHAFGAHEAAAAADSDGYELGLAPARAWRVPQRGARVAVARPRCLPGTALRRTSHAAVAGLWSEQKERHYNGEKEDEDERRLRFCRRGQPLATCAILRRAGL